MDRKLGGLLRRGGRLHLIAHVGNAPSIMLVPTARHEDRGMGGLRQKNPGKLNYASSGQWRRGAAWRWNTYRRRPGRSSCASPAAAALSIPDLGELASSLLLFDSLLGGLRHVQGRAPACAGQSPAPSARRCCPTCPPSRRDRAGLRGNRYLRFGLYGPKSLPPAELAARLRYRHPTRRCGTREVKGPAEPSPGHRAGNGSARAVCHYGRRRPRQVEKIITDRKDLAGIRPGFRQFNYQNPYPTTRLPVFANVVSTSHPLAAQADLRTPMEGAATRWTPPLPRPPPSLCKEPVSNGWAATPSPSCGTAAIFGRFIASWPRATDLDAGLLQAQVRRRRQGPWRGLIPVTVPGAGGQLVAMRRFGKLPFADLLEPAIELPSAAACCPPV